MGSRYAVLYTFHRVNPLSLHRLMQLKQMNPKVTIIPRFGIQQRIYFPTLMRPPTYGRTLNWTTIRSTKFRELTQVLNERVESLRRKAEICAVRIALQKMGMRLNCDFTPMGKINQDLAILNWFSREGRNLDFDFLVYFEYDMLATRTIESLYDRYKHYDAGFVDYRRAHPSWLWYGNPPGVKESVSQWLKDHSSKPIVYRGFFPGHIISREVLAKLDGMRLPLGFCEMRLPTVITGLGFSCARLDFPMVRYRPPLSKSDVEANSSLGLFHPVHDILMGNACACGKIRRTVEQRGCRVHSSLFQSGGAHRKDAAKP